jgi:hypothetical protein
MISALLLALTIPTADPVAALKTGKVADPNFFPLAVWLQSPHNAVKYKAAGINTFVGLWQGPTEAQLAELKKQGMLVICSQNAVGREHLSDPTILAWMHGDEPDNAQAIRGGKGYGPPIEPAKIIADYERIKAADPSRPVLLNLGQGVAWDNYIGRGVRRNHPEDYAEYVKGADIASFDIYPGCHDHKDIAGKLWYVPDGVSRLRKWAGDSRLVWNCIECTHISNVNAKATPQQVKAEVWMSLIRGSKGIIYFCHEFQPKFVEAGLLADAEMLKEVTAVNRQIQDLAPIINSSDAAGLVIIESVKPDVPVEAAIKKYNNSLYIFAVNMRGEETTATFKLPDNLAKLALKTEAARAKVLGEDRNLEATGGAIRDTFAPWAVHLYQIPQP